MKNKIVATVYVKKVKEVRREVESSFKSGADLVEIRFDSLNNLDEARSLLPLTKEFPLIFSGNRTYCSPKEMKFLIQAQKFGAIIDIPYFEGFSLPKEIVKNRLIISYHGKVPSYPFYERLVFGLNTFAKYKKIVPPKDNFHQSAQFLKWTSRLPWKILKLIAFPSGKESSFARILACAYGSRWVYALSEHSLETITGQISIDELIKYDPKSITKDFLVTGLLGYPLKYTESPQIWNNWFKKNKIKAVYLPLVCQKVQQGIEGLGYLKSTFFAVTSPHKVEICNYLDYLSRKAKTTNSVNTVIEKDRKLLGVNTDIYGIIRTLHFIKGGEKVLILGGGGAARSAILALKYRSNIAISTRDEEKGREICKQFGVEFIPWEKKEDGEYDIVINSTTSGSNGIDIPWDKSKGFKSRYYFEMIVSKNATPLEKFAKANGAKVIRGRVMLLNQAKMQMRLFLSNFIKNR